MWKRVLIAPVFLLMLVLAPPAAYSASKTVLVLGDSLSAEYGLRRGTGWVALLEERLNAQSINATVVNASISGETTIGGRSRLPALLARHKPDIVIIELGANDALRGLPLTAMRANLRAMIDAAKDAGARPLLVGMQIPPNYGREYTERFIASYKEIADDTGVHLVPFLLKGVAENPALFQPDRLHPTEQAQQIILENVWPVLRKMLSGNEGIARHVVPHERQRGNARI
jgi:acyl-CoA thioesterase-1